jgi:hypothetical protein
METLTAVLNWSQANKDALAGISSILSGIGTVLAVVVFIFAVIQYRRAEHWKRAEYLAHLYDSFEQDSACKKAMQMLDWPSRELVFEEKGKQVVRKVSPNNVFNALVPETHQEGGGGFTELEAQIRDCFDGFLSYIAEFERAIQQGLVDKRDVYVYLHYWIGMLHGERHLRNNIRLRVLEYAKKFGFENVQNFIDRWPTKPKLTR